MFRCALRGGASRLCGLSTELTVKELIEFIASSLVDDPTQVRVSQEQHGIKTYVKLRVAKDDMGRVIGKQGRVANAMRVLLNVAASRSGKQVYLDIEDPR